MHRVWVLSHGYISLGITIQPSILHILMKILWRQLVLTLTCSHWSSNAHFKHSADLVPTFHFFSRLMEKGACDLFR